MSANSTKGREPTVGRFIGIVIAPLAIIGLLAVGGSTNQDSLLAMTGFVLGLIVAYALVKRQKGRLTRSNVGWPALLGAILLPLLLRSRDEAFSIGQTFGAGLGIGVLCLLFVWLGLAIGKKESVL